MSKIISIVLGCFPLCITAAAQVVVSPQDFVRHQRSDFSESALRDQFLQLHNKARESKTPTGLTLLGAWLYGPCNSVARIDSSHLLIGNGQLVQVLDISDTTKATVVGEAKVWSLVFDLTVRWPYAYVVRAGGYLSVIDLNDLTNPVVVATWGGSVAYALIEKDIRDTPYVYLGGGNLAVIDISNPLQPLLVRTQPIYQYIFWDMVLYKAADGSVYLYARNSGGWWIDIFDVTDPPNTMRVGRHMIFSTFGYAVSGNYLYVGKQRKLIVLSLQNPASPDSVAEVSLWGCPASLRVDGNYLYGVTTPYCGGDVPKVFACDIRSPSDPVIIDTLLWPGPTGFDHNVAGIPSDLIGTTLYVPAGTGVWAVNTTMPQDMNTRYIEPTGYWVYKAAVNGNTMYVADGATGMWVVDVSDKTRPRNIGHYPAAEYGESWDVVVRDTVAFLSMGPNNVDIVSVACKRRPRLISTIQTRQRGRAVVGLRPDMTIRDSLLFIATDSSVTIVNVQNPIAPQVISDYRINRIKSIALTGGLALLARTQSVGLHILDVSNPYNPQQISSIGNWSAGSVLASGNYAFVAAATSPTTRIFVVVDISVPEQPREIVRLARAISATSYPMLAAANGRMYWVITNANAIYGPNTTYLVDVGNPTMPFLRDSMNIGGFPWALSGNAADTLFMSLDSDGVYIYRYDILTSVPMSEDTYPKKLSLENNFPNPFNTQTTILYTVPITTHVDITVYNILGEKVITLVNEHHRPGNYRVAWDGTNSQGNHVSSGVYFTRLSTPRSTQVKKAILMR